MHHDSEKSQSIHSFVTALGLLKEKKKENKQNALAVISRMPTSNAIPMKLKAAINVDTPVQHV